MDLDTGTQVKVAEEKIAEEEVDIVIEMMAVCTIVAGLAVTQRAQVDYATLIHVLMLE